MKLQHIPIGGQFLYEGKRYTKTGPITACTENGGQCMIPRYAVLQPLPAPPVAESTPDNMLEKPLILEAFDRFYRSTKALIPEECRADLEAARLKFLASLG